VVTEHKRQPASRTPAGIGEADESQQLHIQGIEDALAAFLSDFFVELEVQTDGTGAASSLTAARRQFGDLEFIRTTVSNGPLVAVRSSTLVAQSSATVFFLGFLLNGKMTFTQNTHTSHLTGQDLAILDSHAPYRIDVPDNLDALWVRLPRHRLEGRLGLAAEVLAQRIPGNKGVGGIAAQLLQSCWQEATHISHNEALRVSNTLLDLVSLVLVPSSRKPQGRKEALLRQIQNFIDANINDPHLDLQQIASSHGVSIRYLGKIFESEGISPARWLLSRRLEASRQRLESQDYRETNIGDIALASGFNDVSTFNRAFKRHYGAPPNSFRNTKATSLIQDAAL